MCKWRKFIEKNLEVEEERRKRSKGKEISRTVMVISEKIINKRKIEKDDRKQRETTMYKGIKKRKKRQVHLKSWIIWEKENEKRLKEGVIERRRMWVLEWTRNFKKLKRKEEKWNINRSLIGLYIHDMYE